MKRKALKAAFPYTLPICVGFLFLGLSYGFLMRSQGFSFVYPLLMSIFIFAGSMEFVTAELLLSAFDPLHAFLLALMVNARHLFYGLSMLRKYRNTGWKKFYLIFGMCDESFSINCTVDPPEGVDRGWFMFFVTLLNHIYWVTGATLGALLKDHRPALVGVGCSLACLLLFGSSSFIVPAMALIILSFLLTRRTFAREEVEAP